MKLIEVLLALVVGTSFISRRVLVERITAGDLLAGLAITLFLLVFAKKKLRFPDAAFGGLLMVVSFAVGVVASARIGGTILEVVILFFLFATFVVLVNVFHKAKDFTRFLQLIVLTAVVACVIGFWDLAADFSSLPRIFSPRYIQAHGYYVYGEITSGMRNAGQAGAYMLVIFVVIYPLKRSSLIDAWPPFYKILVSVAIVLVLLFLLLTAKIAAYLGLLAGIGLNFLMRRDIQVLKPIVVICLFAFLSFGVIKSAAPRVISRIEFKVRTRILEKVVDDSEKVERNGQDFQSTNYRAAFTAFKDNPFTASGIGAFSGVYHSHEVHSTPLKLVGETGLLGIFGYSAFMLTLFLKFQVNSFSKDNPYRSYLYAMYPFFLGAFISWGYTYHLRKREFWIAAAVITIAHQCMIQWEKQNKKVKTQVCLD